MTSYQQTKCDFGGCRRIASIVVRNRYNADCGFYCSTHKRAAEKRTREIHSVDTGEPEAPKPVRAPSYRVMRGQ